MNITNIIFDRQLNFCPIHFVKTNTVLTAENYHWILESCIGRFSIIEKPIDKSEEMLLQIFTSRKVPAFEDSSEAMLYELTWS